ncbi:MAG: ABC transporter permease [Patescibacteria group bacterium]|jgi:putative ABC transport system permease protein
MIGNFFQLIFRGLRFRPLRSWLTVLGIVVGIMLVAVILALGNGIKQAVQGTLQMFSPDLIMVFPGKESNPILGLLGGARFRTADLMDLENVNGVKFVLPVETGIVTAEYHGEKQSVMLHAQNWDNYKEILEQSQGGRLEQGRYPANDSVNEVVIGYSASRELFKDAIPLGSEIIIKAKKFSVVGIATSQGEQSHDNAIFISFDSFKALTGTAGVAYSAVIKVLPTADPKYVAQEVKYQLGKQSVVQDFTILTPDKANLLVDNVLNMIEIFLMIIALVSLMVGGIGIMNTMYTSVFERTKQIGIMKAIGATREAILMLFLIESGIIGTVGGVFGIAFGLIFADIISRFAAQAGVPGLFSWAGVDYLGALALLVFTFIVGIVAGFLPARAAARLEPAEALRYE